MSKNSLLKRIKIASSFLWSGSPWEAANHSPNRGRINGGAPVDFKHELTNFTRGELVRNMRYLRKNSGLVREFINTMALYSAPVRPQSLVEDDEWRNEAQELYADRCRIADASERFNGEQVQSLISKAIDTDGEIFCLKIIDKITGLPRVQLIEAHRVGDFGRVDTVDGFKINSRGKIVAINILQDNGKSRLVPMRGVLHIFDPESPSAYRGIPTLAHSINHQLDSDEIIAIEKKGVKDSLEVTRIVRSASSDFDEDDVSELLGQDASGNLTEAEKTDPRAMQRILGGKAFLLGEGEDVESWQSNRPQAGFEQFMTHLERASAQGGLPFEFHNLKGLNSVGGRIVLERVKRISQRRSKLILDQYVRGDWFFRIGLAISEYKETGGKSGIRPIKNWHKIAGGFPAQATVDGGRNDESLRRSIDKGLISPSEATAERGKSFDEVIETTAKDIKTVERIAAKFNVDPSQLFQFTAPEKANSPSLSGTPPSAAAGGGGVGGEPKKGSSPDPAKKGSSESKSKAEDEGTDAKPAPKPKPEETTEPLSGDINGGVKNFADLKAKFDAYGAGVRAGLITPQQSDEEQFRKEASLPKMSDDATREWNDESGVRRPITIAPKAGSKPKPTFGGPNPKAEDEDEEK